MTQSALADHVSVAQPTLHDWETGKYQPSYANRLKLAAVLGFDVYAIEVKAS